MWSFTEDAPSIESFDLVSPYANFPAAVGIIASAIVATAVVFTWVRGIKRDRVEAAVRAPSVDQP